MGQGCFKSNDAVKWSDAPSSTSGNSTLHVMFNRFDKNKKGYISKDDLQKMMRDDKTHFQGKDANHIMEKYGTEGKMSFTQFKGWWTSTYTTYNDDALGKLVDEVNRENNNTSMETINEATEQHSQSKLAVSRS